MSSLEPSASNVPAPRSGPRHAAKKQRRRYWPRRRWAQVLLAGGLALVLLVASFAGYLYYEANRVNHIKVNGLSASTASAQGTENILLVGSTDRCALKVQNAAYGLCSQGVTGINSDVVMILHLDWNTSQISILSIPRDTFVPNARSEGANKIDAALYEGPSQLVAAIEQDFAIPIQHFVELNFETFANVVDALGGVKMYFPMPVFDAYSGLNQLATGCIQLNGTQALQVVRARHLVYRQYGSQGTDPANWTPENLSDLARIRRDHEFLRVLATAVNKQGLGDPITDARLISSVAPDLVVDQGLSTHDMLNMLLQFKNVKADSVPQYTLPVMTSDQFSYYYKGGNYGNVTFPINQPDLATIQAFLGVPGYVDTLQDKVLPKFNSVTVSVLNGSGTTGQAQSTADALGALGFQIGLVGDTTPVGNPAETVVAYNSLNPSVVAAAQLVWHELSGQTILAYEPTNTAPVTLVTGTYFAVNAPPSATPSTTTTAKATTAAKTKAKTAASTATTTTTTTIAVPGFQSPNSATSSLQPWDPRSCTASGGEGP
jgi:LCP family protein required for cell wall assembly